MIQRFVKSVIRKKTTVLFNDPYRTRPISNIFGLERGTPVDRYYIDAFLSKNAEFVSGRVLEVSESVYSKKYGNNVTCFEVLHSTADNCDATIIGDLTDKSTLPSELIDCFICTQTFNFIFDVEKAVIAAHHMLKPGGVLLATVAGLCQISRYDMDRWGDYWRFTTASVHRIFEQVFGDDLEVNSHGNVLAACALLQGIAVEDIPNPVLLDDKDPDYQVVITVFARKAA